MKVCIIFFLSLLLLSCNDNEAVRSEPVEIRNVQIEDIGIPERYSFDVTAKSVDESWQEFTFRTVYIPKHDTLEYIGAYLREGNKLDITLNTSPIGQNGFPPTIDSTVHVVSLELNLVPQVYETSVSVNSAGGWKLVEINQ